ncbi:hypothetical protein QAD02_007288, partial [Eretmocerus hayati]
DFVSLSETWVEEKDCKYIIDKLPNSFHWKSIGASREHIKGRAKGGFLTGVKKEWCKKGLESVEIIEEGLIKVDLSTCEGKWNIWAVYNSGKADNLWKIWDDLDFLQEGSLGLSQTEIENMEVREKDVEGELDRRYTDIFRQGVDRKVREARYNTRYKDLRTDQLPEYLLKYEKGIQIDIIARLRCGNLEDKNKY